MLKNLKYSLIVMATIGLSGCFNKDINIQKDAISESRIELTKDFNFKKSVFLLNENSIPYINRLSRDKTSLEAFRKLDFNDLKIIQDYDFKLSKNKKSQLILDKRKEILEEILKIRQEKESEIDNQLDLLKQEHLISIKKLNNFNNDIEKYMKDLTPLINRKSSIDNKISNGKIKMKKASTSLSIDINDFLISVNQKTKIKPDHFLKPLESNYCDKSPVIKSKTINFYKKTIAGCLMTYIPIERSNSEEFIKNLTLVNKVEEELEKIYSELINQGIIKSSEKTKYQTELDELELELATAYKETERKHNVTRYQLEGKRSLLEVVISKKEKIFKKAESLKFKKINAKMKLVDLNKLKPMMDEAEKNYLKSFKNIILGNQIKLERKSFEMITITPNEKKNEVFLIIDSFSHNNANYLDVIIIDVNDLIKSPNIKGRFDGEIIPLITALETKHAYRYRGGEGVDTVSEALIKTRDMLEN